MGVTALAETVSEEPRLQRFRALYRGEFGFVWSAAQHLGVPSGMVDEVVQDVFLTAYRRLDHLRFEVSPRAWLFGVTRRVAFRYRRGAARRARRMAGFAELGRAESEAPQQRHDDAQELKGLLAGLGEGTRVVWELTEILGMSAPEIASELKLPINTVYSRLRLARQQLAQRVAQADTIEALRDATRREQQAPAEAERRNWAVLVPVLGREGGAVGVLAWAKARVVVATLGIAVGTAGVVGVVLREDRESTAASEVEAPRAVGEDRAVVAEIVDAPAPVAGASGEVQEVVGPRVVAGKRVAEKPARADAGGRDRLAEEIAAIDRLQAAMAADDRSAAAREIAEHRRRFPAGTLVDLREAARVELLCRGGDVAGAEAAAQALAHEHAGSAVAQRFENYRCTR
jgi:RNA polymerase sigma factor (sigma-70 family)